MSELSDAINEMRNMRESYDEIAPAISQLASDVQTIKDAHILGFSYDGIIFEEGYEPQSAFGIITNRSRIIEVHDDRDLYLPMMKSADYPELEVLEMRNAIDKYAGVTMTDFLAGSTSLKKVLLPSYNTSETIYEWFYNCPNLSLVDFTDININRNPNVGPFRLCSVLIDVITGKNFTASRNILQEWSPSTALLNNSTSLLTQEDLDAGFTSNREKLLYNIREHIAANLRTDVGNCTITFSAAIKAAILADQATMDAFPSNWTIA